MPVEPFIRRARRGDGDRLEELAVMAMHGKGDLERVTKLARQAEQGLPDEFDLSFRRRSSGAEIVLSVPLSTRVMDRGDGEVVGFSYCAPPVDWLTKESGIPMGVAKRAVRTLIEVNLLAVLPQWRGRGLGAALLAECEARHAQWGYRVAMVVVEEEPRTLAPWYADRGWAFGQIDEPAHVRFWESRELWAYYGSITSSQRLGFKSLVEGARVEEKKVCAPRWRREEYIVAVREQGMPRELLSVEGVLAR